MRRAIFGAALGRFAVSLAVLGGFACSIAYGQSDRGKPPPPARDIKAAPAGEPPADARVQRAGTMFQELSQRRANWAVAIDVQRRLAEAETTLLRSLLADDPHALRDAAGRMDRSFQEIRRRLDENRESWADDAPPTLRRSVTEATDALQRQANQLLGDRASGRPSWRDQLPLVLKAIDDARRAVDPLADAAEKRFAEQEAALGALLAPQRGPRNAAEQGRKQR